MRNPSKSSSSVTETTSAAGGSGNMMSKTTPCCSKVGMKRGPWTPEEDELLANYIQREGEGRWRMLPKRAGLLRCGKSCRLRWMNYLRPSVKRGHIAPDEEDLILRLHRLLGNRWSLIAGRIPGRTDNEIKNYWNTHLSKKLISQGIDPRTHKPLNPNINSPAHDHNKPSSSKPNHNPTHIPSPLEEPILNRVRIVANKENDDYHYQSGTVGNGNGNDDDNDINYCTDEVFTSFLDSLINEDHVFNIQHLQQQPNGVAPGGSDILISSSSSSQMFTFGAGWDAPIMSSGSENLMIL